MSEHARSSDGAGDVFQWADEETFMVIDSYTGEPQRFGQHLGSTGTLAAALAYVTSRPGWELRMMIVKLSVIAAAKISG